MSESAHELTYKLNKWVTHGFMSYDWCSKTCADMAVEGGEGIEISRRAKTCTKFSDHVDTVSTKLNNNNNILNAYYCV